MADLIHKYYCTRCERFLYGETLAALASQMNYHATIFHPADFANWTATNIESSTQYAGAAGPLPQYLVAHGESPNSPHLTDADKEMLAAHRIKW